MPYGLQHFPLALLVKCHDSLVQQLSSRREQQSASQGFLRTCRTFQQAQKLSSVSKTYFVSSVRQAQLLIDRLAAASELAMSVTDLCIGFVPDEEARQAAVNLIATCSSTLKSIGWDFGDNRGFGPLDDGFVSCMAALGDQLERVYFVGEYEDIEIKHLILQVFSFVALVI